MQKSDNIKKQQEISFKEQEIKRTSIEGDRLRQQAREERERQSQTENRIRTESQEADKRRLDETKKIENEYKKKIL